MLCGDFNARTGNFNALSHDDDGDTITFVQTELCEYRQSEDKTVNAVGRLYWKCVLNVTYAFWVVPVDGMKNDISQMFVLQAVVL